MITSITGSILILIVISFYVLFALGYPVGEYIMGGRDKTMPEEKKKLIVVAIILQALMIIILLDSGEVINIGIPDLIVRISGWIFAIYISLNVIMNLFSRSNKEKYLMTPLSRITAVCYWVTILN